MDWQINLQLIFIDSRKKSVIYLVARHTPQRFHYYPSDEEMVAENQSVLDELSIEDILPKFLSIALKYLWRNRLQYHGTAVHPARLHPTMTLLIAMIFSPRTLNSRLLARRSTSQLTSGVYVSENAIYLSQVDIRSDTGPLFINICCKQVLTRNLVNRSAMPVPVLWMALLAAAVISVSTIRRSSAAGNLIYR